ncbi:MAG: hypothetical protein OEU26_03245 [Candidatus Tectomicrobia bacterium]|nr:hypothetical protein [Candidatus Tectomicrobia bacterium]
MSANRNDGSTHDATPYYGSKDLEVLSEAPDNPPATGFYRRAFLKGMAAAAAGGTLAASQAGAVQTVQAQRANDPVLAPPEKEVPNNILAQCPYCGVGCGTLIQTEKGRIVGMKPDPKHPTNKGLQCIKGLTSAEAIYVDRLTQPLIRKDMTNILTGHVSQTKGSFNDSDFREAT